MTEIAVAALILLVIIFSGLAAEPPDKDPDAVIYGTVAEITVRGPDWAAEPDERGLILALDGGGRQHLTVGNRVWRAARVGDRWKRVNGVWVGPLR